MRHNYTFHRDHAIFGIMGPPATEFTLGWLAMQEEENA
jgi:hypothetical protein